MTKINRWLLLAGLVAAVGVFSVTRPASAQFAGPPPVCDDRAAFVEKLGEEYNEITLMIGIAQDGSLIETFSSPPPKSSFTIIRTPLRGKSCVIMAGHSIFYVPVPLEEDYRDRPRDVKEYRGK